MKMNPWCGLAIRGPFRHEWRYFVAGTLIQQNGDIENIDFTLTPDSRSMSIASSRPPIETKPRLFVAADLAALPVDLPSGTVNYELNNGRLLTMVPPGNLPGSIPELVVAIRSKNDTAACVECKVQDYLTAGVSTVVVIDAVSRTATVSRSTGDPTIVQQHEALDLKDTIPGFGLILGRLFEE